MGTQIMQRHRREDETDVANLRSASGECDTRHARICVLSNRGRSNLTIPAAVEVICALWYAPKCLNRPYEFIRIFPRFDAWTRSRGGWIRLASSNGRGTGGPGRSLARLLNRAGRFVACLRVSKRRTVGPRAG